MFGRIRKLREAGVVGINNRNRGYIMPRNPRRLYGLVDDKVRTKSLAMSAGIAVPELYGLIESVHEAHQFTEHVEGRTEFVVKPAHGSGGNGIMVVTGRRRDTYIKGDGTALSAAEVEHHIQNTLGGVYSLGGHPDQAIIEYRVKFDPVFDQVS
ncbi:MAG: alpha-L-glutamate ligase-like protein, partial [Gammaproteobacteria bacterium]|nr:alpha-L-glutamate ligase-like protein [Gammaproteobacteria bacterium]